MAAPTAFPLTDLAISQKLQSGNSSLYLGGAGYGKSVDFTALQLQLACCRNWSPARRKTHDSAGASPGRGTEWISGDKGTSSLKSRPLSRASSKKQREVAGGACRHMARTAGRVLDFRKHRQPQAATACTSGSLFSPVSSAAAPLAESLLGFPDTTPAPSPASSAVDGQTVHEIVTSNSPLAGIPDHHHAQGSSSCDDEAMDLRRMPRHVAIIMDGNSRWATRHGLQTQAGHEAGVRVLREAVRLSGRWGIRALTVFAFSSDNWHRSEWEVSFLMKLFEQSLQNEAPDLHRENVRVRFVGNLACLPTTLQGVIDGIHALTASNGGLELTVAVSYSAREEIVAACQALVRAGARPEDITEETLGKALAAHSQVGDPDLVIRTSGEQRLSNFLLWQLAYAELYFADVLWPDFGEEEYRAAIVAFQKRHRRFGRRQAQA